MSEPVENLYSSSPLSEDEGFTVGRGSTSPEHTSLDKMTSPYYSYRVDKAIQKHDSHYWARHFSILPPRTESPANTTFETPPTLQSAKVPSRASTPIVEVENESLRELRTIYTNFQKCLDLRDKYMVLSLQRLGDNPKDADGWKIYPPPPQPTWPNHGLTNGGNNDNNDSMKDGKKEKKQVGEDFHFEECEMPGVDERLFELDATGVYRVYENEDDLHNNKPAYTVPSIKEYFVDLDFILDVISDGPAKSFAYRRLQILESKWSMHVLLHELEEIAETKVVPHRDFYNVRKVDTHVHLSSCISVVL
ncbi:1571_t:CDS:2 [Paraglomus occultum]|uniref:1571_t:CDS:1 n=1 Tax=Paraglomus occultum TaxID=144539 RepID=A0A9N8W3T4_9GLOM|nr:1571_t:CDS:2 [Paraglomus occultum]